MLTIQKAVKTFNPNSVNEVKALRGIDLQVDKGDFITIIGSNGAGKSTFLNAIAGSFILTSGSIAINTQDVTSWPSINVPEILAEFFKTRCSGPARR